MLVRIDVGADLRAAQAQLAHATLQFTRGEIGILQWDRRETGEASGIRAHDFRDVIVEAPGKIERVGGFRPIAEHDGHRREHLHGDAGPIHFFEAARRLPDIVGDLAEDAIADHHPRATRLVMLQPNESRVAVFRVEIGPLAREDVGVEIDLHRSNCRAFP